MRTRTCVCLHILTCACGRPARRTQACQVCFFAFPFFFLVERPDSFTDSAIITPPHRPLLDHFVLQTTPWLLRFTLHSVITPFHCLLCGHATSLIAQWPQNFPRSAVVATLYSLFIGRAASLALQWPRRFTDYTVAAPLH